MATILDELAAAAQQARAAAAASGERREARDALIRDALDAGHGVREVGRAAEVNPTHVMRVRDRV